MKITFSYDSKKKDALDLFAVPKGVSIEDELVQTMDALYQKHVPANVKSFLDMKTSSQKPKKKSSSSAVGDAPTEA